MVTTERVDAVSMVDRVLRHTRDRILSGEYPPGTRLRLHMLAEHSGASLVPVREALRILETERLVDMIPNRGARVAGLSLDDMNDLYRVRVLLEPETLRESPPLTAEEEQRLSELLGQLREAVKADNIPLVMKLHRRYHFGLYERTRSKWLLHLIDLLWKHTERYQRLSLAFRHDGADSEHREVLKALAAGDRERAAEALRSHLETTARLVGNAYQSMDDQE